MLAPVNVLSLEPMPLPWPWSMYKSIIHDTWSGLGWVQTDRYNPI